jgi:hypothetical protein
MNTSMEWFFKIVRVAGVNFPVAASLVQLQAELNSEVMALKFKKLEDPISFLHEDIPEISRLIYQKLRDNDSIILDFEEDFYTKYSRVLAVLEKERFISKNVVLGSRIPLGINIIDASYIMYLCSLEEDSQKMQEIIEIIDRCEVGLWLNELDLKNSIGLPKYVIRAIFEIYESKGFGILSKEVGSCNYMGNA